MHTSRASKGKGIRTRMVKDDAVAALRTHKYIYCCLDAAVGRGQTGKGVAVGVGFGWGKKAREYYIVVKGGDVRGTPLID